jgi:hypothetical protein
MPWEPFFSLFQWWGMDYIPPHHLGCLCLDHEKCEVSYFMWTNSCPSIAFPSIFSPRGWHHVISDGVHTLANVVIVNPTQTNFVLHVASFHKVTMIVLVQAKGLYHNWSTINVFLLLVECYLHQQVDNFFHWWANNMACLTKGIKFPIPFSSWYIYYDY